MNTVSVSAFRFMNPGGGTGLSNWDHNERFEGNATVKMVKGWHDYECGYRFIGEAVSDDLKAYLDRNAKPDDRRVFFDQFDLVDKRDLGLLITSPEMVTE